MRIVAPFETRVRRWQARAVLSEEDAQQRTRERDQAHIDFVQRFYGADIADPALYDLVISTEKITPEGAVELIVKALGTASVAAPAERLVCGSYFTSR